MRARTGISSRKAQNRTFPHLSKKPCSQRVFSLDGVLRYSCFSSPVSLVYYIYYYARCQLVAHFTFKIALSGAIMLTLLLVCSFSPRKYKSILRGFYNAVSLPGDCHVASLLAMTEYFVRNVTRVCLPESNSKIYVRSLCFSVQRTLCHCERKYRDPAGYFVPVGKRNKQAKDKHFRF